MKNGNWVKGRDDRSIGIEIPMSDSFVKITPTDKKLIIINREIEIYKEDQYVIVGMMKDQKLKLRGLHVSHTLGWSGDWNT
jgi:hypothetical protein